MVTNRAQAALKLRQPPAPPPPPVNETEVGLAVTFPWERESAFWRFVRGRPRTGVDLWVMISVLVPEP